MAQQQQQQRQPQFQQQPYLQSDGQLKGGATKTSTRSAPIKRVAYFHMDSPIESKLPRQDDDNDDNDTTKKEILRLIQVDGSLCSDLILSHAQVDAHSGHLKLTSEHQLIHLKDVIEFKRQFPEVKVLISVRNSAVESQQQGNGFQSSSNNYYNSGQQQRQWQYESQASNASVKLSNNQANGGAGQQPPVSGTTSAAPAATQQSALQRASTSTEFRQMFARNAIEFLQTYHLDGLDIDWQFPNFPSNLIVNREYERVGLTKICQQLRSAIVENFYARQTAQQQHQVGSTFRHDRLVSRVKKEVEAYLLTVAIAGQESVLRSSYELRQLANLCDWLNVMSFDYFLFKAYAPFTGPNAPLEPIVEPYVPILGKLSVSWTLNKLIREEQIPAEKLVFGIATYARAYRLIFKNSQPVAFSLAVGTKSSQVTQENTLSYREVLSLLSKSDSVVEFDERARVPYLLADQGYTWVTYENARSVREKVNYILSNQLAGYLSWNLNNDDYLGSPIETTSGSDRNQANGYAPYINDTSNSSLKNPKSFPLHRAMCEAASEFISSEANSQNQNHQQQPVKFKS